MLSRDVAALFMEHMPDDKIRSLRDSIAKAEAELTAPLWERHRDLHGQIEELKDKCEEAAHSLTIVLAGNVGTRRRLLRNGRNERRTCIICGTEEIGTLATGFLHRFLFRKAVWKFEKLNRHAARTFIDPECILRRAASSGTSRSQPMSCFSMHSLTAYVFLAECGRSRAPFMREFPS